VNPLSFVIPELLTRDGTAPRAGDVPRFAWALLDVARNLGYEVDVHQYASSDWVQPVNGVAVYGHGLARLSPLAAWESIHHATRRTLYVTIDPEVRVYRPQSLVVVHGVWWAAPGFEVQAHLDVCRYMVEQAALVVSVDYNFANVLRATYPALATKVRVIPTYADTVRFVPRSDPPRDQCTVLWPVAPHGYSMLLEAMEPLLEQLPFLNFHIAAEDPQQEADAHALDSIKSWMARTWDPSRVALTTLSPDTLPALYRSSDIVALPITHGTAGTFACLDAMASGCAIVATDVGGLTNLLVSGFNGWLVPPTAKAVSEAVRMLALDGALRQRLGAQARQTALALSRQRWEEAWREALVQVYGYPV